MVMRSDLSDRVSCTTWMSKQVMILITHRSRSLIHTICVHSATWHNIHYLTIRLWARDFYEVIVDEAEGRINYRLVEIESE